MDSLVTVPIATATTWLNVMSETRARRFVERKVAITYLEAEGGHWSDDLSINKELRSVNFESLTRKLTVLGAQLAWDDAAIEVQRDLASRLQEMQQTAFFRHPHSGLYGGTSQDADSGADRLMLRLEQSKDLLNGIRIGTKQIRERMSIQLQTLYSLVSQRDNDLNYATAVASQRISEASQQDSAVMKQLAADNKEVALRTYRDSASMRTMAIINLCTLPGTLQHTSIFDFRPDSGGVVSEWVWLYWAITIGLTIVLLSPWYITTRSMEKHVQKLGSPSPDHSSRISETPGLQSLSKNPSPPIQLADLPSSKPASRAIAELKCDGKVTYNRIPSNSVPDPTAGLSTSVLGALITDQTSLFSRSEMRFETADIVCACPVKPESLHTA
ncbi:hypothetical protein LTR85_003410 [Meristemomyces frigidus]|nr:hypothetical protein LTR85_003410 [Meristemomyces frigidus]